MLFTWIQSDLCVAKQTQLKHSGKAISIMNSKTNVRAHIGCSHHFLAEEWWCYIHTVNEQSDQVWNQLHVAFIHSTLVFISIIGPSNSLHNDAMPCQSYSNHMNSKEKASTELNWFPLLEIRPEKPSAKGTICKSYWPIYMISDTNLWPEREYFKFS